METPVSQPNPTAASAASSVAVESIHREKNTTEQTHVPAPTAMEESVSDRGVDVRVGSGDLAPSGQRHGKGASAVCGGRFYASCHEFYATFGPLGLPMVVAFLLSSLTMVFLAIVQVVPMQVANWLMNTGDLDDGEFWLLSIPSTALVSVSTAMLVVFALCYSALAVSMVFFREHILRWALRHNHKAPKPVVSAIENHHHRGGPGSHTNTNLARARQSVFYELTSAHGVYHAYYNALFDLPKLAFQTATITAYLSEGFPLPLIQLYLTMLLVSWLLSFYRFQQQSGDPEYLTARVFLLFDLFFSVFAPLLVLAYAYHQFNMDREAFAIRQETLSPGSYDRIARLFADPVQVDLFRFGFGHLQFSQVWYLVTKTCLNVLGVYKCKKIIVLLILHRAERVSATQRPSAETTIHKARAHHAEPLHQPRHLRAMVSRALRVHGKRRHLAFGIVAFLTSIVGILTYVIVSVTTSTHNCRAVPECRVVSYRWNAGAANDACPCIVYINRNEAPRSFHEWVNASDVTQSLAAAASSGHLKTVQVVNFAVPDLPESLRHCHDMEQLILVYTQTQSLPDWVGGFRKLHYIHVESDIVHYPLHTLPPTLFSRMHGLRFIRFGGAAQLREFPSLAGLHQLTTLVFSMPHALTELPSFDDLDALVTLVIGDATHVARLPSLQRLTRLRSFSLFRRNAVCCNGFITGVCDLTDFQCQPRADEPPVTCEPTARMPDRDKASLARIGAFVCSANLTTDIIDSEPTALSTDGACGGAVFQQCQLGSRGGMCFNGRMQIVHCDVFGEYEAMRRLQIARGVGGACDPDVEAWLGCR